MKKITGRLIFGAVMLAAVFFMSAFLFPAGVQAVEVDEYVELKNLLESNAVSTRMDITITEDMNITGQINVSSKIQELIIDGSKPDGGGYTLNGGGINSFLKVGKIDLTLQNITIENCKGSDGAVIYADQPGTKITLKDSVFNSNVAEMSGGVVYQEGGNGNSPAESNTLTIEDCTFTENGAESKNGGAIYQGHYAGLKVSNSSFTDNFSEEYGGAIYQGDDCQMVIENTTFKGNISNYTMGGAVFQDERCSLEISGSEFSGNEAYYQGGAVRQGVFSKLTVTGSVFSRNKADERGGAICQKKGGVMTVKDCQFLENKSDVGGAVYAPTNAEVTGTGSETCLFSGNKADSFGGALEYGQDLTVTGCIFKENESYYGGALASPWDRSFLEEEDEVYYFTQKGLVGTVVISDSHFIENTADYGGVWYDSAGFEEEMFDEDTYVYYDEEKEKYYYLTQDELHPVIVVNPDGSETRYDEAGSKVYFDEACGSKITVSGTEFIDNTANVNGGVFFLDNLQTTKIKEDNVFSGNSAPNGKGGVIYNRGEGKLTVSGSEFTKNSAGVTDAICYSDENGIVSFEDNTFTGNTVGSNGGWVFALGGNTTIKNNDFFANTDTKRDMLFKDASKDDEISGNTYRGNFLEDAFSSPAQGEIAWSPEIGVTLDLREVYNDKVRDGAVRISINGSTYKDFDVTDGKAVIKIDQSDLNDGVNNIKAEYISGEYTDEDEYTEGDGYYHYQQPELNFTITKYTVTVTTDGNGTASADPASGTIGTEVTLTVTPEKGYVLKTLSVKSGNTEVTVTDNKFSMPAGDVTVKASFVPHSHDYSFTANGTELTAECKNTDGAHVGSTKAALTLIPPEAPIYDGTAKTASVSGTIPDIVTPAIVYRQDGTNLGGAPVNAGTYTAEITLGGATASAGFTIAPKAVTVTANDKSKKPGETDPDLTATVEGTIGSDTVTYTLRRAEGEEPGTYAVTVAGEVSQGNYSVSFVNGTFTISPKELRTEQPPLTEVPEGLKEIGISSVSEIEQNLLLKLEVNGEPAEIEQTVFIDVVLEVSFDGGTTWEIATPDNFPKGGMEVRLDYPEGTGKDTHEFSVSHMFTVGEKAGQVEYPDVTARDDGLYVWLTGLSPVAIAWRETNTPGPERPGIDFFRLHGDCELPATGFSALRPTVLPEQPKDLRYEPVRMHLMLPMQDRDIELVMMPREGNSWAAAWLGSDAGILEGSALPGEGVSVIAGHNTLNDTDYGPFALLAALDLGDVLFVRRSDGELLRFTVYQNEKIGAGDADALQKSALAYENTLTLLTCEDELPAGGYASRRIVSAKYIE